MAALLDPDDLTVLKRQYRVIKVTDLCLRIMAK